MIERKIVSNKVKLFRIEEYLSNKVDKPGYSHTEIQKTPLGEKIIVHTSRPGLIVGRRGDIIRKLTDVLKNKFKLENPQIEVVEVTNPNLNPKSVAKSIVHNFQRFGPRRFKFIGHKLLQSIMDAGAVGAEIIISGRGIPGSRAKLWRFTDGHLKKSGNISENFVSRGLAVAHLKSGAIGVKVIILTPDITLPDKISFLEKEERLKQSEEGEEKERTVKNQEVKSKAKKNGNNKV